MGWCCPDDQNVMCKENPKLEMYCSYNQPFYEQLKYFSCIRDTVNCGTSNKLFWAVPNVPQQLSLSKSSKIGSASAYGDVCSYEIRQSEFQQSSNSSIF